MPYFEIDSIVWVSFLHLAWRELDRANALAYFRAHVAKVGSKEKDREVLLKGNKAQYGWPPCTNQFRLAPPYIENIIYLWN